MHKPSRRETKAKFFFGEAQAATNSTTGGEESEKTFFFRCNCGATFLLPSFHLHVHSHRIINMYEIFLWKERFLFIDSGWARSEQRNMKRFFLSFFLSIHIN